MPLIWPFGGVATRRRLAPLPYDLVEAVIASMRMNLSAGTLPGGQHYGWVAETTGQLYPYATVLRVSESRAYQSGGIYIATGTLQVSVFGTDRTGAAKAADQVSTLLAYPHLFFQRGRLMFFAEMSLREMKDPDPGPGGVVIYHEIREFSYALNSTL